MWYQIFPTLSHGLMVQKTGFRAIKRLIFAKIAKFLVVFDAFLGGFDTFKGSRVAKIA